MNTSLLEVPARTEVLSGPLERAEEAQLKKLEGIIHAGLQTFTEVGNALLEIRETRLYRTKYVSFGAYCRERWGMTKTHAHRLIAGAEVVENIKQIGFPPIAESVVRPMVSLSPDKQREVWARVIERKPSAITANFVTRVMHELSHTRGPRRTGAETRRKVVDLISRPAVIAVLDGWSATARGMKVPKTPAKIIAMLRQLIEQL